MENSIFDATGKNFMENSSPSNENSVENSIYVVTGENFITYIRILDAEDTLLNLLSYSDWYLYYPYENIVDRNDGYMYAAYKNLLKNGYIKKKTRNKNKYFEITETGKVYQNETLPKLRDEQVHLAWLAVRFTGGTYREKL